MCGYRGRAPSHPVRSWGPVLIPPSLSHIFPPSWHLLQSAGAACSASLSLKFFDQLVSHLWLFLPTCYQLIFLNLKYASVPPCLKPIRGSPLDKLKFSIVPLAACLQDLGSAHMPFPPALKVISHPSSLEFSRHGAISHLSLLLLLLFLKYPALSTSPVKLSSGV